MTTRRNKASKIQELLRRVGELVDEMTELDPPRAEHYTLDDVIFDVWGEPFRYRTSDLSGPPFGRHLGKPYGIPTTSEFADGALGGSDIRGRYISGWGQAYGESGNKVFRDVRLQVRRQRMYLLYATGQWRLLKPESNMIEAAFWTGDHRSLGGVFVRPEGINGASVSLEGLDPYQPPTGAAVLRWWHSPGWYPRPAVPADVVGVFHATQARLSTDHDADLGHARFLASAGIDLYEAPTHDPSRRVHASPAVQPRLKPLTDEWLWYTAVNVTIDGRGTTMTEQSLRQNPPPLEWMTPEP